MTSEFRWKFLKIYGKICAPFIWKGVFYWDTKDRILSTEQNRFVRIVHLIVEFHAIFLNLFLLPLLLLLKQLYHPELESNYIKIIFQIILLSGGIFEMINFTCFFKYGRPFAMGMNQFHQFEKKLSRGNLSI
jgi:hypothetical protein